MTGQSQHRRRDDGGFVLLVVLLVLLALFIFTAPFVTTARNADQASRHLADEAQARLALDAAGRQARVRLESSHAAIDETPYFDSLEELTLRPDGSAPRGADAFDPHDPNGTMWQAEVLDVAGRIDLDSAPPQVFANLVGAVSRVAEPLKADGERLTLLDSGALPESGALWMGGEIIRYEGRDADGNLILVERGVDSVQNDEGQWIEFGPRRPLGHGVGAAVIDQRAFAPVVWRTATRDVDPRDLDTIAQLEESDAFALVGSLSDFDFERLRLYATTDDGLRAGSRWQRSTRLVSRVAAGETFRIGVEDSRWFNAGSTVRITNGDTTELRFVTGRDRNGLLYLDRVLEADYDPWQAEVSVLARRPVNVNTAPVDVLEALFANVGLEGANSRIDSREARALAALVVESRPFTGLEDWVRRLVLPAAGIEELPKDAPFVPEALEGGGTVLNDERDAVALYFNCLNANDARLGFSTMPISFTTRDTYALELRSAVNAESGILRTSAVRERTELVTPQFGELFQLFIRQEDFDEELRLGRRAPWWATGPEVTHRHDQGVTPPSRAIAHLGTLDGAPYVPGISEPVYDDEGGERRGEHVFASREEEGAWCQLAPARTFEMATLQGRMEHFDHELRDLEGRYLPDETLSYDPVEAPVLYTPEAGMLRPIGFEAWVKPRQVADGTLLSVGGLSGDIDRIVLGMEGEDLVLRVLDGFGDHRLTPEREAGEARFRLAPSEAEPGFPAETWHHVKIDVQGNRPDQIGLMVNGFAAGVRRPGLTRLAAAASESDGTLQVESTEGFPERGVARVGEELVEYTLGGANSLIVEHFEAGEAAGSGGRLARMRWNEVDGIPEDLVSVDANHPRGTPVSVYGYSAELATDLPSGGSQLPTPLGPWRLARVMGTPNLSDMDPIQTIQGTGSLQFGMGWLPERTGNLVLALGDDPGSDTSGSLVMPAFSQSGGYAAMVQARIVAVNGADPNTPNAISIGGVEIVRYSGWSGNQISIIERNAVGSLPRYLAELEGGDPDTVFEDARGFVFDWDPGWILLGGPYDMQIIEQLMSYQTYLLPISLPAPGANQITFLQNTDGRSQFAQITETQEPELTEWVRYDDVATDFGHLVRSDRFALNNAYNAILRGASFDLNPTTDPGGGPGGGGGGGGGNREPSLTFAPSLAATARTKRAGNVWDPFRGEGSGGTDEYPMSRAVSAALHFRGVLGTTDVAHEAGREVLPVFQLFEARGSQGARLDAGMPGAGDAVFMSTDSPADIGQPMRVHRAHLASPERPRYGWQQEEIGTFVASDSQPYDTDTVNGDRIDERSFGGYLVDGRIYVAFDSAAPYPIARPEGATNPTTDARLKPRIVKFPSGELPRFIGGVTVGAGALGQADLGVPSASIDEIAFQNTTTFLGVPSNPGEHTAGAHLYLVESTDEAELALRVAAFGVRDAASRLGTGTGSPALSRLPNDAGLLRVGEEIIAYNGYDASNGLLSIPQGGRGMMGTRPQPHGVSESVVFLQHWTVTALAGAVSAEDATLPVVDRSDFPPMGLVLIDDELVHYTRIVGSSLDMPRRSTEPGEMDERGEGVMRGRFGTTPSGHAAGTPVILFPFRYWDRYAARFDGPELSYFGFDEAQPGAWWSGVTFSEEPGQWGGADIVVLQRTDPTVPWDADPEETVGLDLLEDGTDEGDLVPIDRQSDRVEWRVMARFRPGAFDPLGGFDHGWKESPRLEHLGVTFYGPRRVLRSVDR